MCRILMTIMILYYEECVYHMNVDTYEILLHNHIHIIYHNVIIYLYVKTHGNGMVYIGYVYNINYIYISMLYNMCIKHDQNIFIEHII